MQINFTQGIIAEELSPPFLQMDGTAVSLIASVAPVKIAFAHGEANYLYIENQSVVDAWSGPFDSSGSYYLYWDIDMITAQRTFGFTTVPPTFDDAFPVSPQINQHFFSNPDSKMYYWNGQAWIECIRVFAGSLVNGFLNPAALGSQVTVATTIDIGEILFDSNGNPVKEFNDAGFRFLTTIDPIPPIGTNLASLDVGQLDVNGKALQFIPKYYAVSSRGPDSSGIIQVAAASYMDTNNPAFAITSTAMQIGDLNQLITNGYVQDTSFYFTCAPQTPLFVGGGGELTTNPNVQFSIQKVGYVVDTNTIYINIGRQIIFL